MKQILSYLYAHYYYDSKIISIGRIFISLIILFDLTFRYQNLEAHYSNNGVLPTDIIKHYYAFYQYYLSIHTILDTDPQQKLLFFLHFIAAFFLLIGYKTRLFCFTNFILLISLHHRNPIILQGGDDLLRISLFYMIFLPCGKFYSIDNWLKRKTSKTINTNITEFSWMYFIFLINISFVYLFSALLKTSTDWRYSGDALYYALSLETLRTHLGGILYSNYYLLKITTFVIYYIFEILVPLLIILSPSRKIRNISALLIIFLHLLILSSLKVGIFPFIGITTAFMLLIPKPAVKFSFLKSQKIMLIFPAIILILILRFNLATLNTPYFTISLWEDRLMHCIGLAQRWNMFSPGVKKYDGWLILRGIKKDNSEWDIIHNTPKIHYEKTIQNFNYLKGDRWRKFLENYEQIQYNFIKPYFCYYLIQKWNKQHPENSIEALNILYMKKENLPNYKYTLKLENLCLCNPSIDKKYQ